MFKPLKLRAVKRRRPVVVATLGAVLIAAACSSATPSSASTSSAAGSAKLSGSPITILTATPIATASIDESQQVTAGKAAVKAINAAGGINGHPLKITICNTQYDPNVEANCARQAVSSKVAAVVGGLNVFPGFFSTLLAGKVALVGGQALTPPELVDSNSFPLDGGNYASYYGAAALALQRGSKHPGFLACSSTACSASAGYFTDAMKIAGVTDVNVVTTPDTVADYSAAAAQVTAGGVDSVTLVEDPNQLVQTVVALRQAGFTGPIYGPDALISPKYLEAMGPNTKNVFSVALLLPTSVTSNAEVARFTAATKAQNPSVNIDATALQEWTAVNLFAGVANRIKGAVNTASIFKAMTDLAKPVNLGGVIPPYSVVGKVSPIPSAPRIFNFNVIFTNDSSGTPKPLGPAVNPITILKKGKGS